MGAQVAAINDVLDEHVVLDIEQSRGPTRASTAARPRAAGGIGQAGR